MGVCCIVFDIDGMLFEFFMNFLNFKNFFQYFQHLKKIIWCKKKLYFLFHFTFYAIFNSKHFLWVILKSALSLTG